MVSEIKLDDTFPTSQFSCKVTQPLLERTELQKEVAYFCTSEKISLAKQLKLKLMLVMVFY